jgi:hypothetical protein
MAFLDVLRRPPPPSNERIFVVPLAARKLAPASPASKDVYIYYAFLFDKSAEAAVTRVRKEVRDEGYEFLQLTGEVEETTLSEWTAFVTRKFDWMKDALPTARVLKDQARGLVYYSPMIRQM